MNFWVVNRSEWRQFGLKPWFHRLCRSMVARVPSSQQPRRADFLYRLHLYVLFSLSTSMPDCQCLRCPREPRFSKTTICPRKFYLEHLLLVLSLSGSHWQFYKPSLQVLQELPVDRANCSQIATILRTPFFSMSTLSIPNVNPSITHNHFQGGHFRWHLSGPCPNCKIYIPRYRKSQAARVTSPRKISGPHQLGHQQTSEIFPHVPDPSSSFEFEQTRGRQDKLEGNIVKHASRCIGYGPKP